jgi:hypothetical protein
MEPGQVSTNNYMFHDFVLSFWLTTICFKTSPKENKYPGNKGGFDAAP